MALPRSAELPRGKGLARGAPLAGGAPLARTAPLRARATPNPRTRTPDGDDVRDPTPPARAPLPRARAPLARKPPKPRTPPAPGERTTDARGPRQGSAKAPARTGPTPETRAAVIARDRGLCVRCDLPASDVHHRSGRGMGGRKGAELARINAVQWLISLCGKGNAAAGCHRDVEADRTMGERTGYRIARGGPRVEAEDVPVLTRRYGWALPTAAGTWVPCPAPPDGDAREAAPR